MLFPPTRRWGVLCLSHLAAFLSLFFCSQFELLRRWFSRQKHERCSCSEIRPSAPVGSYLRFDFDTLTFLYDRKHKLIQDFLAHRPGEDPPKPSPQKQKVYHCLILPLGAHSQRLVSLL